MPSLQPESSTKAGSTHVSHAKAGFLPWDASGCGLGFTDDQAYWPMHRKLSFSHGSRETESKRLGGVGGEGGVVQSRENRVGET